jgi:uncharacterized ferritin-like protein (DUF455 family)
MPPASAVPTLSDHALAALECSDGDEKLARVAGIAAGVARGAIGIVPDFAASAPALPGRPPRPLLVPPRSLARRSAAAGGGHAALIHALAHIEFNAVNLALDALCRFPGLPADFYRDWLSVATEEALHFRLLRDHLRACGHDYGDFPAHDGLWQMALKTAHDPLARMGLVPRVLEARGLDASPGIIRRLRENGDARGAEIVGTILRDEIGHVAIGTRWFNHLCALRGLDPDACFERLLAEFDAPRPVAPLNEDARRRARFTPAELALLKALAAGRSPARKD